MENSELKHEFYTDVTSQCRTCLSVGRRLRPLQQLADIYKKITYDYLYQVQDVIEGLQVCWQCYALLKKIVQFQEQVVQANELLQTNQNSIVGSLSNLVSVTINETHETVYIVANSNDSSDIQTSIDKNIVENPVTEDFNDKVSKNGDTDVINAEIDAQFDIKMNSNEDKLDIPLIEDFSEKDYVKIKDSDGDNSGKHVRDVENAKNRLKSRWALKKAEENRKPKLKVVTEFIETFVKVHISDEELIICMETDKQSEYYKSKRFKCESCVLGFSSLHNLLKHNEKYHWYCDCCEENCDKRHLLGNISKHFVYRCVVCLFLCRTKDLGLWHFETEHKRVFQCIKCKLQFRSRREFYVHHKCCHEKFTCDVCGISFKMRYCLENHIRKKHSPFECKDCNKRFARYNGLWLHNKLMHRPASPAYCVECDRLYKDAYRLKWHLCNSVTHTPREKLRIPCPSCGKVFTKNTYMKDHYNLVHLKVYKYRCDACDKNFIRNADLVKHKRKIHEGILPPKDKICSVCGRGFTTNKILHNHVRTHTGERPFACGSCEARFSQRSALRAHARAKHGACAPAQ